MDKVQLTVNYC